MNVSFTDWGNLFSGEELAMYWSPYFFVYYLVSYSAYLSGKTNSGVTSSCMAVC